MNAKVFSLSFVVMAAIVLLPQTACAAEVEVQPMLGTVGAEAQPELIDEAGIFDPGGWGTMPGLGEGVFSPDGFGSFSPGGWDLQGMDVEDFSGNSPSRVGLWWRSIKESVSLAFTFDPIKKNEKRLEFAEERMRIAGSFARNVDGINDIKRIDESVRRAQKMMHDIGAGADKWLQPSNVDAERLLGNVMRHQLNREGIFDMVEGRLHDNSLTGIRDMRQQGLQISLQLLNDVEKQDLSPEVQVNVRWLKSQFGEYEKEVGSFRSERQRMVEMKAQGDGEAALKLNKLEKERRTMLQQREVMQLNVTRTQRRQKPQGIQSGTQLHEWNAQQYRGSGSGGGEMPPVENVSGAEQSEEPPIED